MAIDPIAAALMFGGDGTTDINAVHYTADSKSDAEKAQARSNIGAIAATDAATKTALALTDKKLKYLSELTKGQVWDIEDGTSPAYAQTVPSGARCVAVNGVGGKTVVWNQLVQNGNFADATGWFASGATSVNVANNVLTFTATTSLGYVYHAVSVVPNHKYLISAGIKLTSGTTSVDIDLGGISGLKVDTVSSTDWQLVAGIITYTGTTTSSDFRIRDRRGSGFDAIQAKNAMLIDLTKMFGAGNEPSTVEQFRAMFPEDYYAYNTGTLLSADVESVDSKDENSVSLGSLSIPSALRTAHPLHSAGSVYDEYDIERKKFIKRVGSVDLGTFDWAKNASLERFQTTSTVMSGLAKLPVNSSTIANILCVKYGTNAYSTIGDANLNIGLSAGGTLAIRDDAYSDGAALKASLSGVMLYYELATPAETDISEYFSDDNLLTVEAGGTVTFTQDNTVTSNLSVPNETEYAVKLDLATE